MLLKCGKGKQTYQIYHNKLRRWAKAVTYMVNGNSYPLSSVLWIIAAENDSCRPRRGRVVATSEGETARPIRWLSAFVSGFDTRIPGSVSQGISAMSYLFIGVASHIYLVGKIECLSSTLARRSKLVR